MIRRCVSVSALIVASALGLTTQQAAGQTTYTWNSSGTDWATASNWTPSGPPGASDIAQFRLTTSTLNVSVQNPIIAGSQAVNSLTIGFNQNFGGWNFTGTGSLTIGGSDSTGLTTFGPATYTFNGPTLAGASSTETLALNVTTGSTLVLSGNSAITANQGNINVTGGTLRLDNTSTSTPRLPTTGTGTVTVSGGGVFELIGNSSAALTQDVGNLAAGSNNVSGVNTFRITPNGQSTVLNFANSASGFSTRPGTRAVYVFEATTGNLGDANGARITFAGTPHLGANGLLGHSSGGGTVGYAIVKDAGGTNFATWNATNGIVAATPTATVNDATGLAGLNGNSRGQFNPTANTTVTASGDVTSGSLRITPAGAGATLAMGSNNLVTNALMLDGDHNFTITGTGNLGGTGTRYIYVNNPNVTLSTSIVVANGTNPTVFAGPGFVVLTGSGSQNTLTGSNRFVVAGGVVRGNNTQIGFTSSGAGVISLTGGVLEITNGSNGNGSSADFTRPLLDSPAQAGRVTWGAGTSAEIGSGGFSAYGSAASVNIGGNSTPNTLTWNQTNFVANNYALRFGSTQSNAVLRWLNPLDLGSSGTYFAREIHVTDNPNSTADRTILAGAISGASDKDLLKTGTGVLELVSANTYQGNTLVQGGTLLASASSNSTGVGTAGGRVIVGGSGTFGGDGGINNGVTVQNGGTIRAGNLNGVGTLTQTGAGGLTVADGGTIAVRITDAGTAGATPGTGGSSLGTIPNPTNHNFLDFSGTFTFLGNVHIDAQGATFDPNETYSYQIARFPGQDLSSLIVTDQTRFSTSNFANANLFLFSLTGNASGAVFLNIVPEPGAVLGVAAGALGLGALIRRRLRRGEPVAAV